MSARPYRVIAVSVYEDDLAVIDAKVETLRARGVRTSRSALLRAGALALDVQANPSPQPEESPDAR